MTPATPRSKRDAGFSSTEALVVLVLAVTLAAFTAGAFRSATDTVQGDADLRVLYGEIKNARELAINQRRAFELQFVPPNQVRAVRREIPSGTTLVSRAFLEHNTIFMLFGGLPDTPDNFGRSTPVDFGGAGAVMFTADGMLTDAGGTPVNGTIFVGQPGKPLTARAVTIFGPTAMIRTYRWNGSAWTR